LILWREVAELPSSLKKETSATTSLQKSQLMTSLKDEPEKTTCFLKVEVLPKAKKKLK
jgi:hypothetical protein